METTTGIRELKTRLSTYLRRVKAGETITITEHGKPIGRIVPYIQSLEDRLEALRDAGLIEWNGEEFMPMEPVAKTKGGQTVAELLNENRE